MASEVDIANMALGWLGVERIANLADDDECYNNYPICRDACLEVSDWTFAVERFKLSSPDATAPAFGYAYKYLLPSRVLRVITSNDHEDSFEVEGGYLLTDQAVCEIKAVVRIVDTRRYSATFVQMLAARLAATLAIPKTNSKSNAETWWNVYSRMLMDAQANDGRQGTSQRLRRSRNLRKRHVL